MRKCRFMFLTVLLSLVFIFSINTTMVSAADYASGTYGKNITWTLSSQGVLTITGEGEMANSTSATPWRSYSSRITSVCFSGNITSICNSAFAFCSNLGKVTIPDSVTSIGSSAFSMCTNLSVISIPESVTYIGENAFYNCQSISSLTLPSGVTEVRDYTFANCKKLMNSNILHNGVTYIGNNAFAGCTNLTKFTIPDSVTSIGDNAFNGCKGLTTIEIPNSVTIIGSNAFSDCTSLTSATIHNGYIGTSAFTGCDALKSVAIDNGEIGDYAFYRCQALSNVEMKDGVSSIGDYAFYECYYLTKISLPNSIITIGDHAFQNIGRLKSVSFSDNLSSIGESAFSYTGITQIVLPDKPVSIGDNAFESNSLTSVIMNYDSYSEEAFPGSSSDIFHFYYDVVYLNEGNLTVSGKTRTYGTDRFVIAPVDAAYEIDSVVWKNDTDTVELSAGSDGKYKMPDSISRVTISVFFSNFECPSFVGHALVLSDEIGIKFRVSFPEGIDTTDLYVDFEASDGRRQTVNYEDAEQISGSTDRYFIFRINAIELAEDVTATLHFGDNLTITDEYSAMAYINYVQNNVTDNPKLVNLVNALHAYGYYMQASGWSDDKSSHNAIPTPLALLTQNDIEMAIASVSGYSTNFNHGDSGIIDSKFSLTLNSKTTINFSVRPGDGISFVSNGYVTKTIGGITYYQFSPNGKIGPKNLGKNYTVTVITSQGEATFSASAMAYVNTAFNSGTLSDQQIAALAAYYYYYEAAYKY